MDNEIDNLIITIRNISDGKNVHTRNKSVFYLQWFKDNNSFSKLSKLIELCKKSITTSDWKDVNNYLRPLW